MWMVEFTLKCDINNCKWVIVVKNNYLHPQELPMTVFERCLLHRKTYLEIYAKTYVYKYISVLYTSLFLLSWVSLSNPGYLKEPG